MDLDVRIDLDGKRPVVVKVGAGGAAARVEQEAARLLALGHPGLVEVVSAGPVPDGYELRSRYAGRPLSACPVPPPEQAGALVAALAETVADLHAAGVVHGRVSAEHVLLGQSGRPVLCSLGGGGTTDADAPTRADDVAALGTLLTDLLGRDAELDPIPDHRWFRFRSTTGLRRALLTVADHACADPATRRPTARRLAAELTALVPRAALPATERHDQSFAGDDGGAARHLAPPTTHRWRQPARVTAAAALLGALVLATGLARSPATAEPRAVPAGPLPASEPPTSGQPASTTTTTTTATTSTLATTTVPPGVVVEGRVVTVDGRRFEIGEPGDLVTVGDWTCDGVPTAAALRPRTGEVFAFPRWVGEGAELAVGPVAVITGATAIRAVPVAGCDVLVASGPTLPDTPVPEAADA